MRKEKDLKVNANQISNLPEVDVKDSTVTKGKVSGNFTITEQSELEEKTEKVDKNQLFSVELNDYFCPVKFDSSELEKNLLRLVYFPKMRKRKRLKRQRRNFLQSMKKKFQPQIISPLQKFWQSCKKMRLCIKKFYPLAM